MIKKSPNDIIMMVKTDTASKETINEVSPDEWAPKFWYVFDTLVKTYDLSKKGAVCKFFRSLCVLLPCNRYKEYYMQFISDHPIGGVLRSKDTLHCWLTNLRSNSPQTQSLIVSCAQYPENPKEWGPKYWYLFDTIVKTYDRTKRAGVCDLFRSLCTLLPCAKCKEHYRAYMKNYPIENSLQSRDTLHRWVSNLKSEISRTRLQVIQNNKIASNTHNVVSVPNAPDVRDVSNAKSNAKSVHSPLEKFTNNTDNTNNTDTTNVTGNLKGVRRGISQTIAVRTNPKKSIIRVPNAPRRVAPMKLPNLPLKQQTRQIKRPGKKSGCNCNS